MNVAWISVLCMSAVIPTSVALAQTAQDHKGRCAQLIDYYDYYGASRSENSDGARNMSRIGAYIDCQRGRYDAGIRAMEKLLRQKKFAVPPPARGSDR